MSDGSTKASRKGWVVTRRGMGGTTVYFSVAQFGTYGAWVFDAEAALRFLRETDAEHFARSALFKTTHARGGAEDITIRRLS